MALSVRIKTCEASYWRYVQWFVVAAFGCSLCCAKGRHAYRCCNVRRHGCFLLRRPSAEGRAFQLPPLSSCWGPGSRSTDSDHFANVNMRAVREKILRCVYNWEKLAETLTSQLVWQTAQMVMQFARGQGFDRALDPACLLAPPVAPKGAAEGLRSLR